MRRSLSDQELAKRVNDATADGNGIEGVMDLLIAQEALRAQEDAELESWVEQMEADGSPEAIAALAKFQGKDFVPQTDQFEYAIQAEPEPDPVEEVPAEDKPFSWFTKPEKSSEETASEEEPVLEVIEVLEVIDVEEPAEELSPVGSESVTDFERLLNAASAEEEATALEDSDGAEPAQTNLVVPSDEHRNRKPVSQLLVWVGASAVVVPLTFAVALTGFGLSSQAILLDLVLGYLVSGALIATAGLAGKRSGLSTTQISRAVFGVWGNSFPFSFITIARLIISAAVLGFFVYLADGTSSSLPPFSTVLAELAGVKLTVGYAFGLVVLAIVLAVSLLRGKVSRIILLVISIASFVGLAISLVSPISRASGSVTTQIGFLSRESLAAIALVIAVQLILWVELAPNLSKAIPMKPRGIKVFFAILGAQVFLPIAVSLVALYKYPTLFPWFSYNSFDSLRSLASGLPSWSTLLLALAVGLSLVYVSVLNLKTLSLDLIGLVRIRSRVLSTLLATVLVAAVLLLVLQQPELRAAEYLINLFVLAGVLSAGWIGMFIADVGLRKIAYHELSLNRSYGFYGKFNALALSLWLVTVIVAVLLVPINLQGFGFFGLLSGNLGLDAGVASQSIALCLVVLLGLLITVIARIPQIRKQEREVLAVESRREQLNDIFIGQE